MKKVKLAAHRGYSIKYPENTMLAFREALKLDIDMVETDVHMTADGKLVLLHDHVVDRTTNGTGYVRDKTYDEIRQLDAGGKKDPAFAGERVPLFEDFLELMNTRKDIEMNIELKDYPGEIGARAYESCDKAIAMMLDAGVEDRLYINSWSGELLQYIDKKYNHKFRLHGYYPRFLLGQTDDSIFDIMYCVCLFNVYLENGERKHREDPVCDQEAFDFIISKGIEPWVYYSKDNERDLMLAVERGAVAVTSNDPVAAATFMRKNGIR